MAKYIIPYEGELRIQANSLDEAREKAQLWRRFVMKQIEANIEELDLERVSMKPMRDVTEVDDAWLANQRLRNRHREEWEYDSKEHPIIPGSKTFVTHRIALHPQPKQEPETEIKVPGQVTLHAD